MKNFLSKFQDRPPPLRWQDNTLRLAAASAAYLFCLLVFLELFFPERGALFSQQTLALFVPAIIFLAFFFQIIDSVAGMGFGTTMAPLLLVLNYSPLEVVPVLLIVQAFSGIIAGWLHHEVGNVAFCLRPPNNETHALILVTVIGILTSVAAIFIVYAAFSLPDKAIETYIALLVVAMGGVVAISRKSRRREKYREKRLLGFALLAGINKGVGGGGYGPLITLGAIYAGIAEKKAVALTTLAEGFVSVFGAIAFLILMGSGLAIDFSLLPPVLTGSFLASVAAPYLVRIFPQKIYRYLVPYYAITIGILILFRLYIF